jgi:DNA-binding NtrC family response regulator
VLFRSGNISLDIQAKLLGFLQDFTIQPVGGTRRIPLDLRVICATNQSLSELVKNGRFREDLFYRLNVVKFTLPPLRKRREDIPELALHFAREFNREFGKNIESFSAEAFQKFYAHAWPGNIREFQAVVQKAVLFCTGREVPGEVIDLGQEEKAPEAIGEKIRKPNPGIRRMAKEDLLNILRANSGVIYRTAKELGVTRKTLYNKMLKFGIDIKSLRPGG